uniref:Uncharacterized protein n=1 Tax=Plectus sambesii TaxID=2011161 RepID=A0A914WTE4_9BILA
MIEAMNVVGRRWWPTLRVLLLVLAVFLLLSLLLTKAVRPLLPTIAGDAHFFTPNTDVEVDNSRRIQEAEKLLADLQSRDAVSASDKVTLLPDADVLVIVIATSRQGQYLTQVTAQLLDQARRVRGDLSIQPLICSVDRRDTLFDEAAQLSPLLPVVRLHNETVPPPPDRQVRLQWEAQDYFGCLNASRTLPTRARYVLLLEDDAMIVPSFFPLLSTIIKQIERPRSGEPAAYVKLYHPAYLRGLPFYVQCVCCSIILSLLVLYALRRWLTSRGFMVVLFLLQLVLYFFLFKLLSHQFFADARYMVTGSVYLTMPESCCTPAVLYSASALPSLVSYLSANPTGNGRAKDHILDEAPSKLGVIGLMTDTNLVVHIGRFSTLRAGPVNLDSIPVVNRKVG